MVTYPHYCYEGEDIKTKDMDFKHEDESMQSSLEFKTSVNAGEGAIFLMARSIRINEELTLKGRLMVIIADEFTCLGTLDYSRLVRITEKAFISEQICSWKDQDSKTPTLTNALYESRQKEKTLLQFAKERLATMMKV